MKRKIHLLCNAHIDPVWQWEWEEGAAAAISTFRTAADLCEEFEGFIFNHNESLLYQWVEEYEPALFERIRRLVKAGRWHILGGWYIQPDCNMPSGESLLRQILTGRQYFQRKFAVTPRTAANLDPFGHSRSLVQLLAKTGYDSYLYMRQGRDPHPDIPEAAGDFHWIGFDGSKIIAHKLGMGYNSSLGHAVDKIRNWMDDHPNQSLCLIPWGVGNHGGGPSRKDIADIDSLIQKEARKTDGDVIRHSTAEEYFNDLKADQQFHRLSEYRGDLNPIFVGCYTSQVRIKQRHRELENTLYLTEKMASAAALLWQMDYPAEELQKALEDLLFSEFHDILPGSSVQSVEEAALRKMDHGLEILSRVKARAFFALGKDQKAAGEGETPILVYNPHPYPVEGILSCEFMLADQNWKDEFSLPEVYKEGQPVPSQPEKEESNINLDWRKKVVFKAALTPSSMNRFDCRIRVLPKKPFTPYAYSDEVRIFGNDRLKVAINGRTGLVDSLIADGIEYVQPEAFKAWIMKDSADSWEMKSNSFQEAEGNFKLMSREEGTRFSGITDGWVNSVRVIESGPVRTVVEAVFGYGRSALCLRYGIPTHGTEMSLELRVLWAEKDRMLKLEIPIAFTQARCIGQVVFGSQELPCDGTESVSQKWLALTDAQQQHAFTVINDGTYASDFDQENRRLRLTLLRSAGYCAHPIGDRPLLPQDRFSPRMDQGERQFRFWFQGGSLCARMEAIDREALVKNERPVVLSFFPSGKGDIIRSGKSVMTLEGEGIQMTTFKKAEGEAHKFIVRLFETTGKLRKAKVNLMGTDCLLEFGAFEIKTLLFDNEKKIIQGTDMIT